MNICMGCEQWPVRPSLDPDECMLSEAFAGRPLYCQICYDDEQLA